MLAKNPHLAIGQCILGLGAAALVLLAALRGALAQCNPSPPYGESWRRCLTNTYRDWTNANPAPPGWYRRTNRLGLKQGVGTVGLRAEWTNSAPVTLMSSVDGCAWHAEAVVSNGVGAVVVPAGNVVLWRLRQ